MILSRQYECRGTLEEFPLIGPNAFFMFSVTCDGKLKQFDIAWKETKRLALLPTKTVEEAFADLNRGYAYPLPAVVKGATAEFMGVAYYPEGIGSKFVQPVYRFKTESKTVRDEVYVPAIRAEYFEDPKRQVVLESMVKEKPADSKQPPDGHGTK